MNSYVAVCMCVCTVHQYMYPLDITSSHTHICCLYNRNEKMEKTDCSAYDVHKACADEKCAHEDTEFESVTIL